MNKTQFVVLLLLAFGCLLIQGKKEEKTGGNAVAKANTNLLEYIQLFKSLLNQALSKADLSSVRGMLSTPLSVGATAMSVLLGGIVLMAFYESPLSPLPVPPLPQAPVGRFPPENPIVNPNMMGGGMGGGGMGGGAGGHGAHGGYGIHRSSLHLTNPESFVFSNENRRRMLNSPLGQTFYYPKTASSSSFYPAGSPPSIRRSGSSSDVFSYINQAAKNNFKSANNMNGYAYYMETPPKEASGSALESAPSTGAQANQPRKAADAPKNDHSNGNLQAAASSPGHVAFAAPPSYSSSGVANSNSIPSTTGTAATSPNSAQASNQLGGQLNAQQASPVYRAADEARSGEKVSLDHYAIREQAFDPKHLVHSQLSQIEFKTSPELAKLEESLKRSAE